MTLPELTPTVSRFPVAQFRGEGHVHGPDCKHDHHDHVDIKKSAAAHVHGPDCKHDDPHHEPVTGKPGDRYKNPVMRAIVHFFGWFYELGLSFIRDLTGKPQAHSSHPH